MRKRRQQQTRRRRQQKGGDQPVPPLHCQCSESCTNPVRKGQTFCDYHEKHGCPEVSPLTGDEPDWNPDQYNKDKGIQHSHNCHAYAMNVLDMKKAKDCRENNQCRFVVAGKTKGHPDWSGAQGKSCSDVIARTMADIPDAYLTSFTNKCDAGYSKIAVVVDKENDLHYYRQDSAKTKGLWSHKPGAREATNKDAAGALIYRPDRASRYYPREDPNDSGLNYASFCSYMCVPRDGSIKLAGGSRKKTQRKVRQFSRRRFRL